MKSPCPFCTTRGALLVNTLAYARVDKYPVTPGHPRGGVRGVIPGKQHYESQTAE